MGYPSYTSDYKVSNALKRGALLLTLLFCLLKLNAQAEGNIKLGVEAGMLPFSEDTENLGLLFYIEPKVQVSESGFLGLRLGLTINAHVFENDDPFQFDFDEASDNGLLSFVPTFDYYFKGGRLNPYLGVGLGYYVTPYPIVVSKFIVTNPMEDVFDGNVSGRPGLLLRAGAEIRKWRLGIEYNFVLKADIEITNDQVVGALGNSYFAVTVGYVIIGNKAEDGLVRQF